MENSTNQINDKSVYLKAFNIQLLELLDDIERVIPNNVDKLTMKNSLTQLKKANPKMILTMWYKWIATPYGKQIDAGDYEFFINKDYTEDWSGYAHDSSILEAIERMRVIVKDLDETNRQQPYRILKIYVLYPKYI